MMDQNEHKKHLLRQARAFSAEGDLEAAAEVHEELAYLSQREQ